MCPARSNYTDVSKCLWTDTLILSHISFHQDFSSASDFSGCDILEGERHIFNFQFSIFMLSEVGINIQMVNEDPVVHFSFLL